MFGDDVIGYDWHYGGNGEILYAVSRRVTHLNRYLGTDNIETTGKPGVGSSGAPLVMKRDGLVVGITYGALVHEERGLYTGVEAVFQFLDKRQRNDSELVQ